MDSFARDQLKQQESLAEKDEIEEKKNEIAGMFLNAAKGAKNPEKTNALNSSKKNDESVPVITPQDPASITENLVMPDRAPTIANNAEIAKKLSNMKEEDKQTKNIEVLPV